MVAALSLLPGQALADSYVCQLARDGGTKVVRFDVNPRHFDVARIPGEPPRKSISNVVMDDRAFQAESILTDGGWRGFWDPEQGILLTVDGDGQATLTRNAAPEWRGRCQETQ